VRENSISRRYQPDDIKREIIARHLKPSPPVKLHECTKPEKIVIEPAHKANRPVQSAVAVQDKKPNI
jgi:hypothetical protein